MHYLGLTAAAVWAAARPASPLLSPASCRPGRWLSRQRAGYPLSAVLPPQAHLQHGLASAALGHATAEAAASASLAAHHLVFGRLLVEALHILHVIVCRGRVKQHSLWAASLSRRRPCVALAPGQPCLETAAAEEAVAISTHTPPQPGSHTHSSPWPSPLYMLRGRGRQQQQQRSLAIRSFRVHPAAEQRGANYWHWHACTARAQAATQASRCIAALTASGVTRAGPLAWHQGHAPWPGHHGKPQHPSCRTLHSQRRHHVVGV